MSDDPLPVAQFRYSPIQQIGPLLSAGVIFAPAALILYISILQRSALWGRFTAFLFLLMLRPICQQYFLWRTQAGMIQSDEEGLSGKPLLGPKVQLRWSDLTMVEAISNRIWEYPQIEIRSKLGQSLRYSFVLPRWRELTLLIHEHCPECGINVQPPPLCGKTIQYGGGPD